MLALPITAVFAAKAPEGSEKLYYGSILLIGGGALALAVAMNRLGGLAWVARIELGSGERRDAVFRERELLYMEGDGVDIDGDGVADPGWTISSLNWGAGGLAYTEDGRVWAAARLATPRAVATNTPSSNGRSVSPMSVSAGTRSESPLTRIIRSHSSL